MSARQRPFLAALVSLFVTAGILVGVSAPAEAAGAQVYGRVTAASGGKPIKTVKVLLFDAQFTYIKQTKVRANGVYQMSTPGPGSYRLQFIDARPAYDTKSYAANLDVPFRIGSSAVQRNARLHRGGAIGGTVKVTVKGKTRGASNAKLRAIGTRGQIIEVNANKKGEYALAGLGKDTYRVFAYDSANRRVGKSKVIRKVKLGSWRKVSFALRTKPASIRGFIRAGGAKAGGIVYVTAVNKNTGEYWVKRVAAGNLSLRGLTPGSYRLEVPDGNGYIGGKFNVGRIRAGATRNVTITLHRGGTVSGQAVNKTTREGIPNISVRLSDAQGRVLDERPARQDGTFTIGGTVRQQSGMKIEVFAYDRIGLFYYDRTTIGGITVRNDVNQNLGQIEVGHAPLPPAPVQPEPTTPTPTPTVSTPTPTPTASTPTPEPTASTPTPTPTATTSSPAPVA